MKIATIILAIALFGCPSTSQSALFAESKCKEGYEYWFLNRAAAHTDLIGAEMLINGGANIDGKGYATFVECGGGVEYSSPLFVAVAVVAREAVEGDPKRSDRKYVLEGGMKMVELLLKAGANPNIREGEGITPLDLAKQLGHEPTVALLKQYGAK